MDLRHMCSRNKLSQTVYNRYTQRPGSAVRCFNRSEDCNITAHYGIFIHSLYDFTRETLARTFDAHKFEIVWAVSMFDIRILYTDEGLIENLGAVYTRYGDKISFSFAGDPALGYTHNYTEYIALLTDQIMITPEKRLYLVERMHEKSGSLFVKYTYCEDKFFSPTTELCFSFWYSQRDTVIVATWKYDDSYFCNSKLRTSKIRTPVIFNRV